MVENLNQKEFQERVFDFKNSKDWKYKGELPAVIDFYADWCGPCKAIAPVMEELSEEYKGKVNFYKIDTEAEGELSSMFGVSSIPSLLFVPKDEKPQMSVGAMPKSGLKKAILDVLKVA